MLSGAERWLIEHADPQLAQAVAKLKKDVRYRHGVDDIPLMQIFPEPNEGQNPLEVVRRRYIEAWNNHELTPELVDSTWTSIWDELTKDTNLQLQLQVPSCDRNREELSMLQRQNRGVILLPDRYMAYPVAWAIMLPVSERDSYHGSYQSLKNRIVNHPQKGGSIDVEMKIEPPYLNRTAKEAHDMISLEGREGQRFPTYLAASWFRHFLTDEWFDQTHKTILLRSLITNQYHNTRPIQVTREYHGGRLDIYHRLQYRGEEISISRLSH